VRDRRDFQAVARKLAANLQSKGQGQIAFSLREVTGLIEGIAWREKTGDFFFGDVNGRAVWRRKPDGSLLRFSPDGDELLGVFGLAVDESGGALWLATAAVPAMSGFAPEMDGTAALVQLDLDSGVVREIVAVPHAGGGGGSHVFGDLALGPDGSVFVTDSGAPIVWRLAPGAHALELFVESEEFISLQGIVVSGEGTELVVADHANGLLAIDLGSRSIRRLEAPPDTTLIGLDGLVLALNGDVVAIQNGLRPNRVLRIGLSANAGQITAVEVLESGHLTMAAPSLGCIAVDGQFFYVGNAGWTRFENTEGRPSEPRTVPIFRTRL
jgi:sugar lactone lactonase YvrE